MIIGTYIALTAAIGYSPVRAKTGGSPIDIDADSSKIPLYIIELIFAVFFYFGLKLVMTLLFCNDRQNSARLKTLEEKSLPIFPVCFCREAFKIWQTAVIYIVPLIIVYSFMFLLCIFDPVDIFINGGTPFEEVDAGYMTMLFFMSFFMAFDLTLIAYTLYFKIKEKIDYIAIDYHIYGVTLFRKTYVRFNKKPADRYLRKSNNKSIENGKFKL